MRPTHKNLRRDVAGHRAQQIIRDVGEVRVEVRIVHRDAREEDRNINTLDLHAHHLHFSVIVARYGKVQLANSHTGRYYTESRLASLGSVHRPGSTLR